MKLSSMVAAWPFYLAGTVVIFAGFVLLNRWMKAVTGHRPDAPGHVLVVAAVAFVLGAGTIVIAVALDSGQLGSRDARVFVYRVKLNFNGTDTIRLLLPAPLDDRVHTALNRSSGTAYLALIGSAGNLSVEVVASSDVTFEVRVPLVGEAFDRAMSRITPAAPPDRSGIASARIDVESVGAGTADIRLDLRVEFLEFCFSTAHDIDADVRPGSSAYPVVSTVASC